VVGAYIGHAIGLLFGICWQEITAMKGLKSLPILENIEEEKDL